MHKLNSKGISHLLIMLAVIVAIGAIGAAILVKSRAATIASISTTSACETYLGRDWKNGACSKTCLTGAGSLVSAWPYDYCSKAASKISQSICNDKHRTFAYGVCMKVWGNHSPYGTYACQSGYYRYVVASPYDYCRRT